MNVQEFYKTKLGEHVVKRLKRHLVPKLDRLPTLWLGYGARDLLSVDDVISSHYEGLEDKAFPCDYHALPFEQMSFKQAVMWHVLEHDTEPETCLSQIWQVLDGEGKLFLLVPNRLSFWAQADDTPFGDGQPYSARQIKKLLQKTGFDLISLETVLYGFPSQKELLLKLAPLCEFLGPHLFNPFGGVLLIEAKKQMFRGTLAGDKESQTEFKVQPISV